MPVYELIRINKLSTRTDWQTNFKAPLGSNFFDGPRQIKGIH